MLIVTLCILLLPLSLYKQNVFIVDGSIFRVADCESFCYICYSENRKNEVFIDFFLAV